MPQRSFIVFLLISLITTAILVFINGTYYGWVDDAMMANLFRGILTPQPVFHPYEFTGFGPLLIKLYKAFPSVAWYGWFIYALLFFAYLLLSNVFYLLIEELCDGSFLKLAVSAVIFSLLMQEFVQRNNYTILGCLLTGAGILFLAVKKPTLVIYVLSAMSLLAGILIRFEISFIILVFVFWGSFLTQTEIQSVKKWKGIIATTLLCLVIMIAVRCFSSNADAIDFNGLSFYEQLIEDAYIFPEAQTEVESIKLEAVRGFNQFDVHVITEAYLQHMYTGFHFTLPIFVDLITGKLKMLYEFGNRYSGQSNCLNWWTKELAFLLVTISCLIYAACLGKGRVILFKAGLIIITSLSLIILVAVAGKMEDRLLAPLMLFLFLFVLRIINFKSTDKLFSYWVLILPICFYAAYRTNESVNAHKLLEADLKNKRAFIDELNGQSGKLFLLDMYTAYLIHLGPFENVALTDSNEYSAGFQYIVRHFHSTQNYFPQKCGTDKVGEIMDCLRQKGDTVIFAYWNYNIDFLKRWNRVIYKKNIDFEPVSESNRLTGVSNAYIWGPMRHNYYILH